MSGTDRHPSVLVAADYYRPGYKAGGPIRTLGNLVDHLGDEFRFRVITRNHDFSDSEPLPGVRSDTWQQVGKAQVYYFSPARLNRRELGRMLGETNHRVIYLNSLFSPAFTVPILWLRRRGRIPKTPVVLAPRGEFSPEALAIKSFKKAAFLFVAKQLRLYANVVWQASGPHEERQIRSHFPDAEIRIAPNLPALAADTEEPPPLPKKEPGCLKLLFLGRVSRMKNLEGAIEMLSGVEGDVRLTVCGPLEDREYWEACRHSVSRWPGNLHLEGPMEVPHHEVRGLILRHHLLYLPSLGENFGHAIAESLLAGCPVLISDRTPWRGLETAGAGWDLPLEDPAAFARALQWCVGADDATWRGLSRGARRLALSRVCDPAALESNRALLTEAAGRPLHSARPSS